MPSSKETLALGRFTGRPPSSGRPPSASGEKRKNPSVSPDQSSRKVSRPTTATEMDDVSVLPPASVPAAPPPPALAPAVDDDGFVLVSRKKGTPRTLRPRPHPADAALRAPPRPEPAVPTSTVLFYPTSDVSLDSLPRMRLADALGKICRSIRAVRFLRRGGIAVDFPSDVPAAPILATETILDAPVRTCLPKPREGGLGTVVGDFSTGKELLELYGMHEDNPPLQSVRQIGKTRTWVLQFSQPDLPPRVRIFYRIFGVKPFFHSPLQCYKCQRFGHPAELCRGAVVCSKCARKGHSFRDCPSTDEKCVNCAGDHSARYKQCSHRVFAVRVQKHLASNPVSRFEARRVVASSIPPTSGGPRPTSYASALSSSSSPPPSRPAPVAPPSTATFATQTDAPRAPRPAAPPKTVTLATQTDPARAPSPVPPPALRRVTATIATQTDPPCLSIPELTDDACVYTADPDLLHDPWADRDIDPDLFPPYHEVLNEFLGDFMDCVRKLGITGKPREALTELCRMYYEKDP